MADEPDSILLQYIRRFDQKLDRVLENIADLKGLVTNLEHRFGALEQRCASVAIGVAGINGLDLVDSPFGGVQE